MMDVCTAVQRGSGFIGSMTGYLDCQAESLGAGAWQALAVPGSTLQVVLAGFLTIFIALIGYNLLFGNTLTVRSGTLAFVKIGAVFALATSWPAYRTIVYDLVTDGPEQIVSDIGTRGGIAGADGTLVQRLDLTDRALVQLAILGAGIEPTTQNPDVPPPPFSGFDAFALGGSRIVFLFASIASLSIVRIVAGLLVGLGPFFIAFLMFDTTRSLFEGWVRVIAGAALASVGASISLGFELGLLNPWLSNAIARRMAGEPLPGAPTELFVISALFGLTVLGVMIACARIAWSFRLPQSVRAQIPGSRMASGQPAAGSHFYRPQGDIGDHVRVQQTRAAAIAEIMQSTGLRGSRDALGANAMVAPGSRPSEAKRDGTEIVRSAVPLGKSFKRKPGSHVSARATRRDRGA